MGVIKIRSSCPLIKILEIAQRKRPHESCDTHILCIDGYIPCHRYVLMANSPFLRELIAENLIDMQGASPKKIVCLTFPDTKTAHMAQVIAMFYCGFSVCKLEDLFYVMNILKLIGIDCATMDKKYLRPASKDEINDYYQPRYYIDPDSDSDDGDDNPVNTFTTNAFVALAAQNPQSAPAAAVDTQQPGSSSAVVSNNTRKISSEDNADKPTEMEVDSPADDNPPDPEPAPKDNSAPQKVTPISIKALMNKQIGRKRGRPTSSRDTREEKKEPKSDTRESTKVSSKDRERKKEKSNTNSKSSPKNQSDMAADENEYSSDDSIIENVKKRSSLRPRKEEKVEAEPVSLRLTPLRKCRLNVGGTGTPITPDLPLPSSLKKPNEGGGSPKKPKQVAFDVQNANDQMERPIEVKCFYCDEIFPYGVVLETHLSEQCAQHLNGKYLSKNLLCLICNTSFPTLNLWGLIRHVDACHNKVKEKGQPIQNKKPQADDDDDVCSEEEIQVLDSLKVKVFRHEMQNQDKVNAVAEKSSTKDDGSSSNHKLTQQTQLEKSTGPVLNRPLPGNVKKIYLKYYNTLRDCRFCNEPHPSIPEATQCLTKRGYAMCWLCCETHFSPAMEAHYRDFHEEQDKPGLLLCPLCKFSCKSSNLKMHMQVNHFSVIKPSGSDDATLHIQTNDKTDKKRKLDEVVNASGSRKMKLIVQDDLSLSIKDTSSKVTRANASTIDTENMAQSENDILKDSANNSPATSSPTAYNDMDDNISQASTLDVSWGEIDEGIQDFRISKGEKEGKILRNELEKEKKVSNSDDNVVARGDESSAIIPVPPANPTSVQLLLPHPGTGVLEPKVTPALVAGRFNELFNEELQLSSTSSYVVRDDNQPSTSKAALMSLMSPQMPLDYSSKKLPASTTPFAASLAIPKIPALGQQPVAPKPAQSQARGPDSIVKRRQEVYIPQIRSPMPGDRLYCGTVAVNSQNFRCFKLHPDNTPPDTGTGLPRPTSVQCSSSSQTTSTKGVGEIPLQNPE